jgi:hypothetical protein
MLSEAYLNLKASTPIGVRGGSLANVPAIATAVEQC